MRPAISRRGLLRWSLTVPILAVAACANSTPIASPGPTSLPSPVDSGTTAAAPTAAAPAPTPPPPSRIPEATRTPVAPIVTPTSGGVLRWLVTEEPAHLNPAIATSAANPSPWSLALFRGLTRLDPGRLYQPLPDLAASWQVSSDLLSYTFKLRNGITWHDGTPLTADDVKFTLDLIRDPKNRARAATDFNRVAAVDVVDPTTVRVQLTQPLPSLPVKLAVGIVPKHLLDGQDPRSSAFTRQPVGTGPFKFGEWRPRVSLSLEANPGFVGGRPGLDRIVFLFEPDPATQLQRLQGGEAAGASLPPKQARDLIGSTSLQTVIFTTAAVHAVGFNPRNPLFADPKSRLAVQRAIDRGQIAQNLYGGLASPVFGPFKDTPYDVSQPNQWTDDPAVTPRLMNESGWKKNASGFWEKAGKPFAFNLTAPEFAEEAQAVTDLLKKAGFSVSAVPSAAPIDTTNVDRVDTWLESFGSPVDPDGVYPYFSSKATIEKGGLNYGAYQDAQVDAALERGRTASDDAGRRAAYADCQNRLAANPACAYTVSPRGTAVIAKAMRGVPREVVALGEGFFFWNVEKWALS